MTRLPAIQAPRSPLRQAVKQITFPVPRRLSRNHIQINSADVAALRTSIEGNHYRGRRAKEHFPPARYERLVNEHLHGRLEGDRRLIVPWLDQAKPLDGCRILEVGSGTGCSTIALAEQGAKVVGIDINADALAVASDRCRIYGIEAEFHCMNATAMARVFGSERFDSIIFFATLEHMTIAERLAGLRDAWAMLPVGGQLVIVETPNRLWYYDGHTSWLPFFHWLPNELAFRYASFSSRENFRELWLEYDAENKEEFLRTGRGVSFHEFDLAIRPAATLRVVSSLSTFQGLRYKPQRSLLDRRYKALLRRICPHVHPGFCDDSLYLVVEKDA
jgi:2-polyprenyl-3-methyl-5-hydroxy-6-metoxy-1,4-benzoquinol methylase